LRSAKRGGTTLAFSEVKVVKTEEMEPSCFGARVIVADVAIPFEAEKR